MKYTAVEHYADPSFSDALIAWQQQHGRHALPWQNTRDAYLIWLSEIMLQQTQVSAVLGYYARFLERFPTLRDLAEAPVEDVMAQWSGLGYYTRARTCAGCARGCNNRGHSTVPSRLRPALPPGRARWESVPGSARNSRARLRPGFAVT